MNAPNTTSNQTKLNWLILVAISTGVPIAALCKYHAGETSSWVALLSGGIVLLVGNVAALIAFRKRYRRDGLTFPNAFIAGAATLAVASLLVTLVGVSLLKHRNGYADLASSNIPLSRIEPEQKRLVVELIRRTAANSQEENKEMAEALKEPMNPSVYSPASFVSQQVIDSTMMHLKKYTAIDSDYFGKQQSAREEFKRKMALSDPQFLESWNAKRQQQELLDKETYELERDWFASVQQLYGYAAQHTKEISVKSGGLVIPNTTVRDAFNKQLEHSEALHTRLVSSVQEQVKRKQELKAQLAEY